MDRMKVLRHRAAWAYVHGEWPEMGIDHIDKTPGNDWISNLQIASQEKNLGKRRASRISKSGVRGVFWRSDRKKWCAQISIERKPKHIGLFKTKAEAIAAYNKRSFEMFGDTERLVK
jgi:hypothetical protein